MFILTVHWDLRSVWAVLTVTAKFYFLCFLVAAIYTTYFLIRTASRLHQLPRDAASTDATRVRFRLIEITRGIETLRQFHILLFLLFGLVCTNEIFATLRAIQYSLMSLSAARIDVFEPVAALAFCTFAMLVFLHTFQWIVAARLQPYLTTNFNHLYSHDD
jgi:hypothetical protein